MEFFGETCTSFETGCRFMIMGSWLFRITPREQARSNFQG
jgi:hypothetical protein